MPSPEASRRNLKKIRHLSNGQPRRSLSESLCNNSLILQGALQSGPKSTQVERAAQLGVNQSHISRYSRRLFQLAMEGHLPYLESSQRVTLEDLAKARRAREQVQFEAAPVPRPQPSTPTTNCTNGIYRERRRMSSVWRSQLPRCDDPWW